MSLRTLRILLLLYEACVVVVTYRPRRSPLPLFMVLLISTTFLLDVF